MTERIEPATYAYEPTTIGPPSTREAPSFAAFYQGEHLGVVQHLGTSTSRWCRWFNGCRIGEVFPSRFAAARALHDDHLARARERLREAEARLRALGAL